MAPKTDLARPNKSELIKFFKAQASRKVCDVEIDESSAVVA